MDLLASVSGRVVELTLVFKKNIVCDCLFVYIYLVT
jgi:hypothetical protein